MTVESEAGVTMVVVAGLVDREVQVPEPVAPILTVLYWQMVWAGPPLGAAATVMSTVSSQPDPQ